MQHAILRLPAVQARTGLSRSTVYVRIAAGAFPAPIRLGPRSVGWVEAEVESWIEARIAETRSPLPPPVHGRTRILTRHSSHASAAGSHTGGRGGRILERTDLGTMVPRHG